MNNDKNEGIMYKALAFGIFVILAVLIILISVSTVRRDDENALPSDTNEQMQDNTTPSDITDEAPDNTTEPQTSDTAADTSADAPKDTTPPDTTAPKDTTVPDTTAPKNDAPTVEPPTTNVTAELAAFLAKYPNTVLGETPDAGQEYIDKMVFLGDSTTYGLRHYSMLSGGQETLQVWTPYSGTLALFNVSFATIVYPETDEEITIKEAVSRKKPEYLVITLGVNGVSMMGETQFKTAYKGMLESIREASPDTKVICQSMFPVARSYDMLGSINNEKIRNANKWIVEVADEMGVKFIDAYSVLCDSEGWLPESYHNGDGIHLNPDSFTIELNNLRTHAYN